MTVAPEFEDFQKSIVRFRDVRDRNVGVGSVVTDRLILTCAHVVNAALDRPRHNSSQPVLPLSLDFPLATTSRTYQARVVFWRPTHETQPLEDIAVLELEATLPRDVQPIALKPSVGINDHPCSFLGFPSGSPGGAWSQGVLQTESSSKGRVPITGNLHPGYWLQPGFSGSPVWDHVYGGVVGMMVQDDLSTKPQQALMMPTTLLAQAWVQIATEDAKTSRVLSPAEVLKKDVLEARFKVLSLDLQTVGQRLNRTIDPQELLQLNRQLAAIQADMVDIENQLQHLMN